MQKESGYACGQEEGEVCLCPLEGIIDTIPPRVEYSLTRDGEALRRSMMPLMEWASSRTLTGK